MVSLEISPNYKQVQKTRWPQRQMAWSQRPNGMAESAGEGGNGAEAVRPRPCYRTPMKLSTCRVDRAGSILADRRDGGEDLRRKRRAPKQPLAALYSIFFLLAASALV